MTMMNLLKLFVLIPIIGFVVCSFIPKHMENAVSRTINTVIGLHLVCACAFILLWLSSGFPTLETKEFFIYQAENFEFLISFYFDKLTAVYLFVGSFLTFLVTIYCSYYLHRESGYKRFFVTILIFFIGYNLIIFSGNLETLFLGWEILGICSFLLIGYYRERFLPVKNALKVFTVFRVADMAFILALWLNHHIWHENITFSKLSDTQLVVTLIHENMWLALLMSMMLLVAAMVKSAQLPFSSWMPRAMEGPTPSSAIFYGSLSVHLGAFLLLRTYPFWEHQTIIVALIILIGLTTSIVATAISRVQASIKAQIAYSSVAQIGIILIEIALGFHILALVHIAGNAFLRTYQLLVSPSVVAYLIREQFYNFVPRDLSSQYVNFKKIKLSIFVLCIKEFSLDSFMYVILWRPMKWVGRRLSLLPYYSVYIFVGISCFAGLIVLLNRSSVPDEVYHFFPVLFVVLGFFMAVRSFTERRNTKLSWILIVANHLTIAFAFLFYEDVTIKEITIYLSGVILSGIIGYICLQRLGKYEHVNDWNEFQGHVYEHPKLAFVFLLSCLGLMTFPITPSFLGVDLIFTHVRTGEFDFTIVLASNFIIVGLSLVRMYSRIFLGPHIKKYHATPGRHS